MTYRENKCIIKDSVEIRALLNNKFADKGLFKRAVTNDAKANGRTFSEGSLSRYLKHGNVKFGISSVDIQWLCERYNIKLKLTAKTKGGDNE